MCMSTILRTASSGEYLYPLASTLMTAPYTNLSLRTLSVKWWMQWLTWKDGLCRIKWSWMLKGPKTCGSPSRSPVQFLLLLISGLLNWRGSQSFNYWVYMYRTISSIVSKACKRIHSLRVCRTVHLPRDIGLTTYITKIRPVLKYSSPVWGGLPIYLEEDLQRVQNRCLNVIGPPRDTVESLVTRRQNLKRKEFKRYPRIWSTSLQTFFRQASGSWP